MIWHLVTLTRKYLDYNINSRVTIKYENLNLPSVTICNNNPFRKSLLTEENVPKEFLLFVQSRKYEIGYKGSDGDNNKSEKKNRKKRNVISKSFKTTPSYPRFFSPNFPKYPIQENPSNEDTSGHPNFTKRIIIPKNSNATRITHKKPYKPTNFSNPPTRKSLEVKQTSGRKKNPTNLETTRPITSEQSVIDIGPRLSTIELDELQAIFSSSPSYSSPSPISSSYPQSSSSNSPPVSTSSHSTQASSTTRFLSSSEKVLEVNSHVKIC